MNCKRCGARLQQGQLVCPECGVRQRQQARWTRCAHCHRRVVVGLTVCPHCGREMRPAEFRWTLWFAGALAIALIGWWALDRIPVRRLWTQLTNIPQGVVRLVEVPDSLTPPLALGGTYTPIVTRVSPAATRSVTATVAGTASASTPAPSLSATAVTTTQPSATGTTTPAPPTATVAPTPGKSTYKVQPGDTLLAIGAQTGVPWETIARLNNLNEYSILQTDQELILPTPTVQPTPAPTQEPGAQPTAQPTQTPAPTAAPTVAPTAEVYHVQSGDTLEIIGQRFGVDWHDIASANNLSSYFLQIGQELVIPKKP